MRKCFITQLTVLLLISITVIFLSCNKESTRVRIFNADPVASGFDDVKVGPAEFGYVPNGKMTGYKGIPEGNHNVTWSFNALDYTKTVNISEQGDYTIRIWQFECELMKD